MSLQDIVKDQNFGFLQNSAKIHTFASKSLSNRQNS